MLDFQNTPEQFLPRNQEASHEIPTSLLEAVSKLSNRELNELEDELDFFGFTGLMGANTLRFLAYL